MQTCRSLFATALTDHLLGAFTTTDKTQTTASTDHFLGAFGLTDHLEERVQRLNAEPANGTVERQQGTLHRHQRSSTVRSNAVLAGTRTDRPPITPHPQSPERFWSHRSPLATALTDNFLGAFAITDKPETTASTDHLLGAFGWTDHLEKQAQRLDAEPANG